jgi:hypothetical protein
MSDFEDATRAALEALPLWCSTPTCELPAIGDCHHCGAHLCGAHSISGVLVPSRGPERAILSCLDCAPKYISADGPADGEGVG